MDSQLDGGQDSQHTVRRRQDPVYATTERRTGPRITAVAYFVGILQSGPGGLDGRHPRKRFGVH